MCIDIYIYIYMSAGRSDQYAFSSVRRGIREKNNAARARQFHGQSEMDAGRELKKRG